MDLILTKIILPGQDLSVFYYKGVLTGSHKGHQDMKNDGNIV